MTTRTQYIPVADEPAMRRLTDELWGDSQLGQPGIEPNPPWQETAAANRAKDERTRAASDLRQDEALAAARARDRVLAEPNGPGGSAGRSQRFQELYIDELGRLRKGKLLGEDLPAKYARTGHDRIDAAIMESNARLRRLASDIRSERAIEAAIHAATNVSVSRPVQHARPGRAAEHAPPMPRRAAPKPLADRMEAARRVAVDRCTRESAAEKFGEYFNAELATQP